MNNTKSILYLLFAVLFMGCNSSPNTLSDISNPASPHSSYPYLYNVGDQLYMSWITDNSNQTHSLNYSSYSNGQWASPKTIATDSTWFVNWADFPSIIADNNGPVAAHWLNLKNPGPLAYDIQISTFDSSNHWNNVIVPHDDGTPTEHGFVSMIPWDGNSFLAIWLDGRQTAGRSDEDYYNLDNAMTLRGALITKNGTIKQQFLIDESVCDCCQTSLVKTPDGAMVAYRNRTDDEIRDIYTSRFNGEEWTDPKAIYNDDWEIGACPVNGPKLTAENSLVAVAWHTAAREDPTAKLAYSKDSGKTFSDPVTLNKETSLGRVDAEIIGGRIYISWMEKDNGKTTLKVSSFDEKQQLYNTQTVATLNESRKTGFPQMERLGNNLIFAWTSVDTAKTKILTKRLSVE